MKKIALLIGVSEYEVGFEPLPATRKDVEAMQRIFYRRWLDQESRGH